MQNEWRGFQRGSWEEEINVRDFIQKNYTPYDGDDSFLEGPTQDTTDLWNEVLELSKQEREAGGVLDVYKRQEWQIPVRPLAESHSLRQRRRACNLRCGAQSGAFFVKNRKKIDSE